MSSVQAGLKQSLIGECVTGYEVRVAVSAGATKRQKAEASLGLAYYFLQYLWFDILSEHLKTSR
jgi:hypothetical protein